VARFGRVQREEESRVLSIVEECYLRLKPPEGLYVDLCLFERSSLMEMTLREEKKRPGIPELGLETGFFATHDAWRGLPRIMVCLEKVRLQPRLVGEGGIRHEVGHSVLHGSLEYYIIPAPPLPLETAELIQPSILNAVTYLVSVAVKDYEVTRLLRRGGYLEDQAAFCRHFLEPSGEEQLAWRLAQPSRDASILFLASCLKSLACAAPLSTDERWGCEVREAMEDAVNYLPGRLRDELLRLVLQEFPKFGDDTLDNVNAGIRAFLRGTAPKLR